MPIRGMWRVRLILERCLALLGIVPILLGLGLLFGCRDATDTAAPDALSVTGVDNLGVYMPVLTAYTVAQLLVSGAFFRG